METPTWETCKENVVPIKRGRSAKGLEQSLGLQSSDLMTSDRQKEVFESQLVQSATGEEKFDVYVKYFKWTRDSFPTNSDAALKLLERCTCEMKEEDALKNDIRFIKLWIEYADLVRTPGEIFSFMQSNKIGEKVALFWIAWAFVAEKAENFKMADSVFQKGIRRKAEPRDLLQKRYHQFQRRMARYFINKSELGELTAEASAAQESLPQRTALGHLKTHDENGVVADASTARSSSGLASRRQTTSTAASRPVVSASSSSHSSKSQRTFSRPSVSQVQISIFSDHPNEAGAFDGLHENSHWKELAPVRERSKENDGPITTWTEAPLTKPSNNNTRPAFSTFSNSTIAIFEDSDLKTQQEEVADSKAEDTNTRAGLSIRRKLDGTSLQTSTEHIALDPLARHKMSTEPVQEGGINPVGREKYAHNDPPPSQPKSTSTSTNFLIFSDQPTAVIAATDQLPKKQKTTEKISSEKSANNSFVIFDESHRQKSAPPPAQTVPSATKNELPSGKFSWDDGSKKDKPAEARNAIFCDPAPSSSKPTQPPSTEFATESNDTMYMDPMDILKDETENTEDFQPFKPQKELSFAIFESTSDDNNPRNERDSWKTNRSSSGKLEDSKTELTVNEKPSKTSSQAKIRLSEAKKPLDELKTEKSKVEEEEERLLEAMLDEIGVLDNEDGTINTRIARRDIDSMFCSPEKESVSAKSSRNTRENTVDVKPTVNSRVLAIPSYCSNNSFRPRPFDGVELSAIKEASCEYSMTSGDWGTPRDENQISFRPSTAKGKKPTTTKSFSIWEDDVSLSK